MLRTVLALLPLFGTSAAASTQLAAHPDRAVIAEQHVLLDAIRFRRDLARVGRLRLATADGLRVDVVFDGPRPGVLSDAVFRGRILGDPHGQARVVVNDGVVRADVTSPAFGRISIRPAPEADGAVHVLRAERGPERVCDGVLLEAPSAPVALGLFAEAQRPVNPPTGETIDVLIVYTASTRTLLGGVAGVEATIDAFLDYTHQAYEGSGVEHRLRIVHAEEVTYTESGNTLTDLARLRAIGDGFLDDVHPLRDTVGADCVCLFSTSGSAGTGYQMTPPFADFEDRAFSAIFPGGTGIAFAHELGHNMGCGHNNGPSPSDAAFCYSYGHRTPDNAWRTIMSSSPGTHVNLFSSPALSFGGFPLGIDGTGCPATGADCVSSLNGTASAVAAFRPTQIP